MGLALSSVCPLSSSTPHGHHTIGLPSTTTSHFFAPIDHCRSGRCPLPSHAPPRFLAAAQLSFSPGRRRGGCLLSQSILSPRKHHRTIHSSPPPPIHIAHAYIFTLNLLHTFPTGHSSCLPPREATPFSQQAIGPFALVLPRKIHLTLLLE
jgi:hypothetical protein